MPKPFTEQDHERYCIEFIKDLNITKAAARAGICKRSADDLMKREAIQERIAQLCAERNRAVKIEANDVLRQVLATALVDPNEIVQVRRGCCRHCHGVEHRYQYVNQRELARARTAFEMSEEGLVEAFEHGGVGFDPKREPVLSCTGCGGEGSAYVHVNDTRNLSPEARALFAGAKQTKDGIEVKLHSQDKSRELLLRHLGLLNDKLDVNVNNLGERILAARKRARGS